MQTFDTFFSCLEEKENRGKKKQEKKKGGYN